MSSSRRKQWIAAVPLCIIVAYITIGLASYATLGTKSLLADFCNWKTVLEESKARFRPNTSHTRMAIEWFNRTSNGTTLLQKLNNFVNSQKLAIHRCNDLADPKSEPHKCFENRFLKANRSLLRSESKEAWYLFKHYINDCYCGTFNQLDVYRMITFDDVKFYIRPSYHDVCDVVTFGIGHEVEAEFRFLHEYSYCKYIGVDPDPKLNKALVEVRLGGKFVQAALGTPGNSTAMLLDGTGVRLSYAPKMVPHEDILSFLKKYLPERRIDLLLIDTEGGEYGVLRTLAERDAELPPICQINFELHFPPKDFGGTIVDFFDSMLRIIENGRFRPVYVEEYKNIGFFRVLFVNIKDYVCVHKYLCHLKLPFLR